MILYVDIPYIKRTYNEYLSDIEGGFALYKYLIENGFFEAPASAGHHLSIDGGLAIHSCSVLRYALSQRKNYGLPIPIQSIIKCALLHDVCKMFFYEKQNGKWQYKKGVDTSGHGQRSIDIIETFIKLNAQEKEMIRWHMGVYSEYFDGHKPGDFLAWSKDKNNKNINAALFLYMCDHFSSMFLEG